MTEETSNDKINSQKTDQEQVGIRRVEMAKGVTLADIAAQIGVSAVAVSKALSGKPGVSEELRSRIKETAAQMGYVPSVSVKPAVTGTGNIGVVVRERYYGYSITFYGQLYERVVRALYDNEYYGILELLTEEDEKAGNLPKMVLDGKVDGLIFLGQMDESYILKMIRQTRCPVFFLDAYIPSARFDTVISDGYYGTYQLTDYLIEAGHKRIGFVGSVDATSSIADRFWGYRRALRENNIRFEEDWEIPDRDIRGACYEKLAVDIGKCDAYVCNCDVTAQVMIRNLEDAGCRVPEDVSVVGFDNFLPLGMESDRITTYEVDLMRMAGICVRSLIKKIRNEPYAEGIQIVTGRLVERESVKRRTE